MATSSSSGGAGPSLASYDTLFTHHKAGMKDEDKEKIKKIVYEMSKDSPFFKEQERRDRVWEIENRCDIVYFDDEAELQLVQPQGTLCRKKQ